MFAYIKGIVNSIESNSVVVDYNGIGFNIMTSTNVTSRLSFRDEVTIYTYMNVREDDISLYGFLSQDEITVFKMLISISGIGPKGALSVMSVLTIDELKIAVISGDHKAIAKANGVGAKTAQRVIIDLKDKFNFDDILPSSGNASNLPDNRTNDIITETAMALTTLGYSNIEAVRAIKKVPGYTDLPVEKLLKEALKHII